MALAPPSATFSGGRGHEPVTLTPPGVERSQGQQR